MKVRSTKAVGLRSTTRDTRFFSYQSRSRNAEYHHEERSDALASSIWVVDDSSLRVFHCEYISMNRARAIISAFSDILVQTLEQLHLPTYLKHCQSTTLRTHHHWYNLKTPQGREDGRLYRTYHLHYTCLQSRLPPVLPLRQRSHIWYLHAQIWPTYVL